MTKNNLSQHQVIMIGDSFLRGIRENVGFSLSNQFSTYSMVKPGCDLKNLLESANGTAENLTQNDMIVICAGSNDFNLDKVVPTTDHIMEFIKTYNRTNIALANVPVRYDLSYYSQINKGIRSYNRKLLEIADEHKQVALIEIDIDRKYHTRHGLHFNKQGKLLFSNKITQAIYTTLGKKLNQRTERSEKYEIRGDVSKPNRSLNQGREDSSNSEKIIKLVQNDVDKNNEGQPDLKKQEITSGNSEDRSGGEKYSQINNEVVLLQDPQRDDENEHSQDNVDNNQPESDKDKIVGTCNII